MGRMAIVRPVSCSMIYLVYFETSLGIEILHCRDEIHFLDMLVEAESRPVLPFDAHWHGDGTRPAMRILALTNNDNPLPRTQAIIAYCAAWLRRN